MGRGTGLGCADRMLLVTSAKGSPSPWVPQPVASPTPSTASALGWGPLSRFPEDVARAFISGYAGFGAISSYCGEHTGGFGEAILPMWGAGCKLGKEGMETGWAALSPGSLPCPGHPVSPM